MKCNFISDTTCFCTISKKHPLLTGNPRGALYCHNPSTCNPTSDGINLPFHHTAGRQQCTMSTAPKEEVHMCEKKHFYYHGAVYVVLPLHSRKIGNQTIFIYFVKLN